MSDSLRDLFFQRKEQHDEFTTKILLMMENVTTGIASFINGGMLKNYKDMPIGQFEWTDVLYFTPEEGPGTVATGGLVMIVGSLAYSSGDIINVDGKEIEITQGNKDYFTRMIRIGLPYELVTEGTPENIVEFLIESSEQADEEAESEAETVEMDETGVGLTEEQKRSLEMFAELGGKHVH